jgi:hypothetical protein
MLLRAYSHSLANDQRMHIARAPCDHGACSVLDAFRLFAMRKNL